MKFRKLWLGCTVLITSFLITQQLTAQDGRKLTLQEAVDLSLKNSKQLKNSHAKTDESTAAVKEAMERRLPDVNVTGSYLHLNSPHINLKTGSDSASGNGGKQQKVKVSQAAYGIVNLSLPIYSGFRIQYGIESAKYLEKATQLDAENDREGVIQNTIDAFSNLYKAKAAADLVKESLNQAQQRAKEFGNLEKNGLLARNDLLKAQLQASNTELSLLDAENNWKLSTVNMNLMLGLPEETILVPDSSSLKKSSDIKSIAEWEQLAVQNRKDASALSFREKAAITNVKAIKGELYPSLALTGGYIAAYVPNLITVTNAVNVGLGVQYNIGSLWKTKSKIQQAQARVQQVQANEDMLNDAIRIQINQAYQNVVLSRKKIDVYQKAIEQATENYKITKNKYDNTLVTTTELLEAEVAELQAKLNYAFANADEMVAYNKLLQSAGVLNNQLENK
ncbi:MAG: TolC family protein [Chitinophagaceae bacterium]